MAVYDHYSIFAKFVASIVLDMNIGPALTQFVAKRLHDTVFSFTAEIERSRERSLKCPICCHRRICCAAGCSPAFNTSSGRAVRITSHDHPDWKTGNLEHAWLSL